MWGIEPKELSLSVGARLPIRTNSDDRYFNDSFQALPKNGYTKMIENKQSVSIFPRLAAGIYDALLMLGVWFTVGSLALIIQYIITGNIGSWPSWLGLSLVILSTWSYFIFFWLYGGKTLGMSSWKIEVVNPKNKNLTLHQELLKSEYNEKESVNLILKRGQISLHDVYLVHGSDANLSSKSRRGMTMRFMPTTSVFDHNLAKEKYNNLNVSKFSNRKIYLARGYDKSKRNNLEVVNLSLIHISEPTRPY